MTPHDKVQELLALSAAGALEPAEERQVREHVRECAECMRELQALADLAAGLRSLPAPPVPAHVAARVSAYMAAYADRRHGALMAGASAVMAWILALATLYLFRAITEDAAAWRLAGWLLWATLPAMAGASAAAAILKRRERISS
jgi:anti-sigma factor RsiW